MRNKPNYGGLDRFRILAALLVVAIHTSPLTSISEGADFFLTRILARIAVPFFFMVTGQFVAAGLLSPSGKHGKSLRFLRKTALLYAFCILLYLPIGIYAGHYKELTFLSALRMVVFDGTFYHLWYFPACILGMLVVWLMSRALSLQGMTIVSAVLYVIGLFGDSYFGLAEKVPALKAAYDFSFQICSYTRNGLFFAPLFLVLGMWMAALEKKKRRPDSPLPLYIGLAVSFGLMTAEGFLLRHFQLQRHDSMYFALVPTMFFLYQCLLYPQLKSARYLRSVSMWIYVLHPAFIVVVRAVAKPLKLTALLVENSLVHYLAVALLSAAAGLFMTVGLARLQIALPGRAKGEAARKEPVQKKAAREEAAQKEAARKASSSRKKARPVSGDAEAPESWEQELWGPDADGAAFRDDYSFADEDSPGEGDMTEMDFQREDGLTDMGFHGEDELTNLDLTAEDGLADTGFHGEDELTDLDLTAEDGLTDTDFRGEDELTDLDLPTEDGWLDADFQAEDDFMDLDSQTEDGWQNAESQAKSAAADLDSQAQDDLRNAGSRAKTLTRGKGTPTENDRRSLDSRKGSERQQKGWQDAESQAQDEPTDLDDTGFQAEDKIAGLDFLTEDELQNAPPPAKTRYLSESISSKHHPAREMISQREQKNQPKKKKEAENMQNQNNQEKEPIMTPKETSPEPESANGRTATTRAWIELDSAALEQNVNFLRSRLPEHCRLMPAVKAEAYGHGALLISRQLSRLGVDAFCVACASEGVELREDGIQGEILILGYTSPEDFPLLCSYQLTQTVVDYPYAQELNRFGQPIHVHIGIDTGMHRVGIRCERIEEIADVYRMQNLVVDGIFTHLCTSDSPHPDHRDFTKGQIDAFYQVVDILQEHGYPCHGQHILASYGILNLLPDRAGHEGRPVPPVGNRGGFDSVRLAADYVRPGIVLYGVLSTQADLDVWKDFIRPVLSLKARVTSIRPLYAGESVGYGITYTAEENMRIAAISIGYGDGLPRELSNGKGSVLVGGHRAPIVGRICMDQTIVDVSGIPNVRVGDTAVVIGTSGTLEITAGQIAEQCNTITHEILTGLAPRLERIWG